MQNNNENCTLWIADAFTDVPFSGGAAGVCIFDEFPPDELMQSIARELGFSNSAFLKKLGTNHFHIRWFTPVSEAPICGHATVAAMHVLITENIVSSGATVVFESIRGKLYVANDGSWYNLNFPLYEVEPIPLTKQIVDCVGIEPIYCGFSNNIIMLEYAEEKEVRELVPNLQAIKQLCCRAISVTSVASDYDFITRYFAPKVGINEDPVCASSHCFLVPYWSKKLGKNELISYQASTRGAKLRCKNLGNRVLICGECVTVFKGNIFPRFSELLKSSASGGRG